MAKLFEVLVPSPQKELFSGLAPTGVTWERGLAVSIDTSVALSANGEPTFKLAVKTEAAPVGFVRQPLSATGLPTDMQMLWGDDDTDAWMETPDLSPGAISIEPLPDLLWIRDDASHTLVSTTNPPTAVAQKIAFDSGKIHIAQTGEFAVYEVVSYALSDDDTYYVFTLRRLASSGAGVA